ncbi:MAG: fibronectin type III domain-containing protein [Rikenellaceae bacterium]|jgi:hypothetical protein|nr:fibronectin type III domain-containing protein [Rikenellaceae bacterium]
MRISTAIGHLRTLLFGLLLAAAVPATAWSQSSSYPVHVTVQVLQPYGVYLSDYYAGNRDRLIVTLLNRGQGQGEHRVKLRVTVKSGSSLTIMSRDELYYPPIELDYGTPLRLTGAELAPYLAPERIAVNGYLHGGKLPTGMTEFTVQAIDYNTSLPVSAPATGRAWLELKQPPMLNLPANGELTSTRTPQYIRFQWMPRHQGVAQTVYEFTLKELPDNGAAPQSAFMYGNPVYQTTTRFTTLNYTHLEPPLDPGKRYAWQVKATAMDGIDEIGMFENNGQSEVWYFETGDDCPAPTGVRATAGWKRMTVEWQPLPEHEAFVVEYRPRSLTGMYDWRAEQTLDNTFTAAGLTLGWTYEYRVGAMGRSNRPVYSPTGEVTLPENDEQRLARCGIEPTVELTNQEPNEWLRPGDEVTVGGDFPMSVTEVEPQGGGWYSGRGVVMLPWIFEVNVAVKFDRLRVNTDNRQIDGMVESEYDPKASQVANLNELDQGGSRTVTVKVTIEPLRLDFAMPEGPVAEYSPVTGLMEICDGHGNPVGSVAVARNSGQSVFPIIVVDTDGNRYQIDAPQGADISSEATPADSTATEDTTVVTEQDTVQTH